MVKNLLSGPCIQLWLCRPSLMTLKIRHCCSHFTEEYTGLDLEGTLSRHDGDSGGSDSRIHTLSTASQVYNDMRQ